NRLHLVAGAAQLFFQESRRIVFGDEARLEVEARRIPEIGMGRPREAIDAAVFAAAIRIDRLQYRNVRRVVPGNDAATGVGLNGGAQLRYVVSQLGERVAPMARLVAGPAVIGADARLRLVS